MSSCKVGVYDCRYKPDDEYCTDYDGAYFDPKGVLVYPLLTGLFMCASAFGLGANDAANSWATSVSSGAISLLPATIIAGICEFSGALSLGYGVSGKLQSGVSSLDDESCWACGYCDSDMTVYQMAMLASQISAAMFLLLATFSSMPVSATHAIIGAIVGASITAIGADCLNWQFEDGLGGIVASWVISPCISAVVGCTIYATTRKGIIESPEKWGGPRKAALAMFPLLIFVISFYMSFLILIKSIVTQEWELRWQLVISACLAIAASVASVFIRQRIIYPRLPSHAVSKGHEDAMVAHAFQLVSKHSKLKLDKLALEAGVDKKCSADTESSVPGNNIKDGSHCSSPNRLRRNSEAITIEGSDSAHDDMVSSEPGAASTPARQGRSASMCNPSSTADTEPTAMARIGRAWSQSIAFSPFRPRQRERALTLGDVMGPEGPLQDEIQHHGEVMKDSVEAQLTVEKMLEAGIEPADIEDLKDDARKDAIYVFRYLLVFNAALESFAHGANDTANSTTAFSASMQIYREGLYDCSSPTTDWWIMAIGGGFVALGVYALGWRVIRTVGERLTSVNYHRGFCIEFASTVTVVLATILDIPISTTHCQIGAVVGVGLFAFGPKKVDFSVLGLICLSWIITLPFAGLMSSAIMEFIKLVS